MEYILTYEDIIPIYEAKSESYDTATETRTAISRMRKIPNELKDAAIKLVGDLTRKSPKQITGLELHPDPMPVPHEDHGFLDRRSTDVVIGTRASLLSIHPNRRS